MNVAVAWEPSSQKSCWGSRGSCRCVRLEELLLCTLNLSPDNIVYVSALQILRNGCRIFPILFSAPPRTLIPILVRLCHYYYIVTYLCFMGLEPNVSTPELHP